jgi:D-arginine dehydrogenase
MIDRCNILIVGGGFAGIALGAMLADWDRKVWILDQEECTPAHASWLALNAWDPNQSRDADVARLSWAATALWDKIAGALVPKGALHLFRSDSLKEAADMWTRGIRTATGIEQLEPEDLTERFPWLNSASDACAAALWVPPGAAGMIDLGRLYSHYRDRLYQRGGKILLEEGLVEAAYGGRGWTVHTTKGAFRADVIVNCGGAWADDVARRCSVRRLGFHSTKRAAISFPVAGSAELPWRDGPFLSWHRGGSAAAYWDVTSKGRVLVSPAEEASWNGGDVEPEGWQIAAALNDFESATGIRLDETSGSSWGWVRTSMADGRPVIGWARETPHFFWMTGFGRAGAECALSGSAIASDMISNRQKFSWLTDQYGIRSRSFAPDRLAYAGVTA